jgi:hypothetical protein
MASEALSFTTTGSNASVSASSARLRSRPRDGPASLDVEVHQGPGCSVGIMRLYSTVSQQSCRRPVGEPTGLVVAKGVDVPPSASMAAGVRLPLVRGRNWVTPPHGDFWDVTFPPPSVLRRNRADDDVAC